MSGETTDNETYSEGGIELLDEARLELERSTDDLERVTEQLHQQAVVVERLEMLVAEILELLPAPAVVVDADERLAAVSQGATDAERAVSRDTLGQPVRSVLPAQLARDIMNVVKGTTEETEAGGTGGDRPGSGTRWVRITGASVMRLPEGWALVILES